METSFSNSVQCSVDAASVIFRKICIPKLLWPCAVSFSVGDLLNRNVHVPLQ